MDEMENFGQLKDEYDNKNNHCQSTINLQKCLKSSVENVLKNVTDEMFIGIYKTCYKKFVKKDDIDRPSLGGSSVEARKYRNQFNAIVTKTISEVIDETMSSVDDNLKKLEELKREQSDNTVFWRPPGNVLQHMIPFEYLCEYDKKKELEHKIGREQEAINMLKARLQQKRLKTKELHEQLLDLIDEIKKMVTTNVDN